jgi:2-haloacid dehalogenase
MAWISTLIIAIFCLSESKKTSMPIHPTISTVIFDFGGVLIDWNPRYLYRKIFSSEEKTEWFLQHICHMEWNLQLDKGYPFAQGVEDLQAKFPEYREEIAAYHHRWPEMLGGEVPGTVDLMDTCRDSGYRILGLTNWSVETFQVASEKFPFLQKMEGIVVSGQEGMVKPDPGIYHILLNRYDLRPEQAVFIDDNKFNIEAAKLLGFHTIHFTTAEHLRHDLQQLAII